MESLQEQIEYGGTCVHGRSTGTPGGFDVMCGDCELGYTERLTCFHCGVQFWGEAGEVITTCEPNVLRKQHAEDAWKYLQESEDRAHARQLLAPIIRGWQATTHKRLHLTRQTDPNY